MSNDDGNRRDDATARVPLVRCCPRIREQKAAGVSSYAIAKRLNAEGTRTRYGCEFTTKTVQNILSRPAVK